MRLSDHLDPALVFCDLEAADCRDLLFQISERVSERHPDLDKQVLLGKLQEREEKSSSGLEGGVAVPHAMVPGVRKAVCVVIRTAKPINLKTMDNSPVRIVFALISSPENVATHIRILARIARLCSIPKFIEKLNSAGDAASLFEAILEEDSRHV
jgi:PTS system nitrogen regulatory IIA component